MVDQLQNNERRSARVSPSLFTRSQSGRKDMVVHEKKISHNRYLQTMEQRLELLKQFMTDFEIENDQGKILSNICSEIN